MEAFNENKYIIIGKYFISKHITMSEPTQLYITNKDTNKCKLYYEYEVFELLKKEGLNTEPLHKYLDEICGTTKEDRIRIMEAYMEWEKRQEENRMMKLEDKMDYDEKQKFFKFITKSLILSQNYIWLAATLIHEKYKQKYSFKSYEEDLWVYKKNQDILSDDVKEMMNEDIQNLRKLLLEYSDKYTGNTSTKILNLVDILNDKVNDKVFMKSVFRELRELFYEESYTYVK